MGNNQVGGRHGFASKLKNLKNRKANNISFGEKKIKEKIILENQFLKKNIIFVL